MRPHAAVVASRSSFQAELPPRAALVGHKVRVVRAELRDQSLPHCVHSAPPELVKTQALASSRQHDG